MNLFGKVIGKINMIMKVVMLLGFALFVVFAGCEKKPSTNKEDLMTSLKKGFTDPPVSASPGVYWYFLSGNRDRDEMTKDLESMVAAGINRLIFLEVDLLCPQGPVVFMSDAWQDMFVHAVRECERLGIEMTLGLGPGWTGSGGPWVQPELSMQHLVSSSV